MWQWQYIRAQEIARERIEEAEAWRRARNASRAAQGRRDRGAARRAPRSAVGSIQAGA